MTRSTGEYNATSKAKRVSLWGAWDIRYCGNLCVSVCVALCVSVYRQHNSRTLLRMSTKLNRHGQEVTGPLEVVNFWC